MKAPLIHWKQPGSNLSGVHQRYLVLKAYTFIHPVLNKMIKANSWLIKEHKNVAGTRLYIFCYYVERLRFRRGGWGHGEITASIFLRLLMKCKMNALTHTLEPDIVTAVSSPLISDTFMTTHHLVTSKHGVVFLSGWGVPLPDQCTS